MESKEHKWTAAKRIPSNTPQAAEAKATIRNAVKNIEEQSYATHGASQSYQMWFKSAENARETLQEAYGRVVQADRAASEVYVVDLDAIERRVIAASIADKDVQDFLPFRTEIVAGENHFHIVNNSGYTVETKYHYVMKGATICAKGNGPVLGPLRGVIPTCPGCLAKSKNVIASHIQSRLRENAEAGFNRHGSDSWVR